jgi:hypothetical protein
MVLGGRAQGLFQRFIGLAGKCHVPLQWITLWPKWVGSAAL